MKEHFGELLENLRRQLIGMGAEVENQIRLAVEALVDADATKAKGVIERDIESRVPDKNAAIILYCGGGFRSTLSADSLQKMGYRNVASMAGGWRAWQEAGAPVESGHDKVLDSAK